jgi:hypothetical protein
VPLHTSTAPTPRRAGFARAAIIVAAAGIAVGGTTIAVGAGQPAPSDRAVAESWPPAISRYDDLEANKAKSMRALGLAMMQESFASPYRDVEANKAIAIRALGPRANEQTTRASGYRDLEANKARTAQAR